MSDKPLDRLATRVAKTVKEVTEGDPVKLGRLIDEFRKQLQDAVKETKHDDG